MLITRKTMRRTLDLVFISRILRFSPQWRHLPFLSEDYGPQENPCCQQNDDHRCRENNMPVNTAHNESPVLCQGVVYPRQTNVADQTRAPLWAKAANTGILSLVTPAIIATRRRKPGTKQANGRSHLPYLRDHASGFSAWSSVSADLLFGSAGIPARVSQGRTSSLLDMPISAIVQLGEAKAGLCRSKTPQPVIPAGFLSGNPAFKGSKPGFPTEAFGNDG